MTHYLYYESPVGRLLLAENGAGICRISYFDTPDESWSEGETPLLSCAVRQLDEYFAGSRTAFDLPLSLTGTDFQRSVWNALSRIPYGTTCSYQDIAKAIGRPKACRAVGQANNRNPVAIILPCHRVVGQKGTLVGYAGGLAAKEQLLRLEGGTKSEKCPPVKERANEKNV